MVPTAHADIGALSLDCGPRATVPVPARGQRTHIVLDSSQWGSKCGDGSAYAFWVRLAPMGFPAEQVMIHHEGGGFCNGNNECLAGKLSALGSSPQEAGILSSDPTENPFASWTAVFLPYCTQDLGLGGGVTQQFPDVSVERYGAVNVRSALRYIRDVLWQELDANSVEGYRPDRLRVLFGGSSAGGLTVLNNYHYLLDDLRWVHTTAVPDSGLLIDNGTSGHSTQCSSSGELGHFYPRIASQAIAHCHLPG